MNSKFIDFKLWSGTGNQQQVDQSIQNKVASCLQESTKNLQRMQQQQQQTVQQQQHQNSNVNLKDKLHDEIGKIKQWKLTLDQEITEYQQKLSEKEGLLEKNRTETKDLQLKVETISLKLQEEYDQRSEVRKRIENTRDICEAMKEQVSRTEKISKKYEQVRDDIDEINCRRKGDLKQLEKNYETLVEKTKDAMKSFKESKENFQRDSDEIHKMMVREKEQHNESMERMNESIALLEKNAKSLNGEIRNLKEEIEKLCDERDSLQNKIAKLNKNLQEERNTLEDTRSRLDSESKSNISKSHLLYDLRTELNSYKSQLSNIKLVTQSTFSDYSQLGDYLKEILSETIRKVSKEIAVIKQDSSKFLKFHSKTTEIKAGEITKLNQEKNLLDTKIDDLEKSIENKNIRISEIKTSTSEILIESKILEGDLNLIKENTEEYRCELKKYFDNINTYIEGMAKRLNRAKTNQNEVLKQMKKFIEQTTVKYKENSSKEIEKDKLIENLNLELGKSKEELNIKSKESDDHVNLLESIVSKFVKKKKTKSTAPKKSFEDYIDEIESMIEDKISSVQELESKFKTAEKDNSSRESKLSAKESELEKLKKKADKNAEKNSKSLKEKEKEILELKKTIDQMKAQIQQQEKEIARKAVQQPIAQIPPTTPKIAKKQPIYSSNVLASPELGSISSRPRVVCDDDLKVPPKTPVQTPLASRNSRRRSARGFTTPSAPKQAKQTPKHFNANGTPSIPFDKIQDNQKKLTDNKSQMSGKKHNWFDSDSVFGFGE